MAGTIIADRLEAASTSQLVIENGVALTPPTIVDVNNVAVGTFCRAWVNFNGIGTIAIRASFNVSSITDNGTGDFTINLTNAMPDVNYSYTVSPSWSYAGNGSLLAGLNTATGNVETAPTTTAARFVIVATNNTLFDAKYINASFFR